MKENKNLVHGVYEVLDENRHKYTSTTVSGGGTNLSGGIDAISSSVSHHSDQEIWVQDLDSGSQRKFDFSSFNVDVRPGHKLIVVWDQARGSLERVINIDTQTRYHGGGAYNTWDGSHVFLRSRIGRVLNAGMISLFSMVPLLGWALMALLSLISVLGGRLLAHGTRFRGWRNRVHGVAVILCVGAHAMISVAAMNDMYVHEYWLQSAGSGSLLASLGLLAHYFSVLGQMLYYGFIQAFYYGIMSPEWTFMEVVSTLGGDLIATLRAFFADLPSGRTVSGYWWSHTAGIAIYIFVITWLVNRGNGKAIVKGSNAIDNYVAEVKKGHPALA